MFTKKFIILNANIITFNTKFIICTEKRRVTVSSSFTAQNCEIHHY